LKNVIQIQSVSEIGEKVWIKWGAFLLRNHRLKMMQQQQKVDYELVKKDVKLKAGMLFTYFAIVRVAPWVIDIVSSK